MNEITEKNPYINRKRVKMYLKKKCEYDKLPIFIRHLERYFFIVDSLDSRLCVLKNVYNRAAHEQSSKKSKIVSLVQNFWFTHITQ